MSCSLRPREIREPACVKQTISSQFSLLFSFLFLSWEIYSETLMTGPVGNSEFCFPSTSMFPPVNWGSLRNNTYCFPCGQVLSAYCYQRAGSSCLQCSSPVSVLSAMTSACYDSPSTEIKDNFTDPIRCEVKWILCLPSNCRVALWQLISPSISTPTLTLTTKASPQHRELHALLFAISLKVL